MWAEWDQRSGLWVWLVLVALIICGLQVAAFHRLRHDDAFITFRYGQNLATGAGPVFNPGERVQASTSPGHVLMSAALYRIVGEARLPAVMAALGCVGWTAQAAALFWLLSRRSDVATALFIALAVAAGAARSFEWVALETNLVMALVLWACAFAFASRWVAVAVCCALAGLMRPDAFLVAAPLGVWCVRELGWRVWRPLLVGLATAAPWWLFAAWYYGSPVPHTAATTFHRVGIARYARHLFFLPAGTIGLVDLVGSQPVTLAFGLGVGIVGAVVLIRRDPRFWVLAVYGVLHVAAYLYLRPFTRAWHDYPAALIFTIFALTALAAGVRLATRALRLPVGWAVLGIVVLLFGLRTYAFAQRVPHAFFLGSRDKVYRQVAAYLREHAGPTDLVLTEEPGTIAYYSHRPMYDLIGLVTPGGERIFREATILDTNRVLGVRWVVLYPFRMPPEAPPALLISSGDFRVYLMELAPVPEAPSAGPAVPHS